MNLTEKQGTTLLSLLQVEHAAIAKQLKFVSENQQTIDEKLLISSISLLDELSRAQNERARKIVITVSAILWTYKQGNWEGLKDFLILILSRVGFPPSAIMIDSDFDNQNGQFSGLNSILNEFNITVSQLEYEIFIGGEKFLITHFQKKVWKKLHELRLVGISAPTSAGKSFIILLKGIESLVEKRGNIIYIVPTLSLVAQVSSDFNKLLRQFEINDVRISTTYNRQDSTDNKIYVLTQEKAISAFSQSDEPFQNIRMLVVDEIQNIERVSNQDDQRAKTLYDTLIEFRHTSNPDLTIISGPRVEGLKELGIEIFDQQSTDSESTKVSPVASLTYAISSDRGKYFFNQYSDLLEKPNKIFITEDSMIEGYGRAQYKDDFLLYLSQFIKNLGPESRNIIFSPTTSQARKTALKLSELETDLSGDELIVSLANYMKDTVHEDYDMCKSILKGFAYHHGKVPPHIRAVVEEAIRSKMVKNIVCTTTLMQGVNLPAQNVILRNPDLSIIKRNGYKPKLTDYEIANLRGRAGRLLKDFIGRTYILEEDSFEHDDQMELFPEAEKNIKSGYGEKYTEHKSEINRRLTENTAPSQDTKEFGYLMTYIRQIVLKHGIEAPDRLNSVGISIEASLFNDISSALNSLEVPRDVCSKNRYWDPVDLNRLYGIQNYFDPPTSISEPQLELSLQTSLQKMKEFFSSYYDKYFGVNDNLLQSATISAKEWMKEKTLKEILNSSYFDDADKIESRISLLQNNISFGLPMLLKPIYDIKAPENMFLRFIEIGAYKPITRKIIELNIPRETAIYITNKYFTMFSDSQSLSEQEIIDNLRGAKKSLDYWRKIQLQGIV
jgi:hypothetical protein